MMKLSWYILFSFLIFNPLAWSRDLQLQLTASGSIQSAHEIKLQSDQTLQLEFSTETQLNITKPKGCHATGDPIANSSNLKWYFDGNEILAQTKIFIPQDTTHLITYEGANKDFVGLGNYQCKEDGVILVSF